MSKCIRRGDGSLKSERKQTGEWGSSLSVSLPDFSNSEQNSLYHSIYNCVKNIDF